MRVLIVEDELKMASLVGRGLLEEGHEPDIARSGEDALAMASATDYDAIVLDVMLPGLDGFELCRSLRAGGVRAPVLMLAARERAEDRALGLDAGADDYLTKPFVFSELLARLGALARRGPAEEPSRDRQLRQGTGRARVPTERLVAATVEADGVGKEYGSFAAVHDLTFAAEAGEILGVLGPNGAGKTTAIRVLTTILAPTRGAFTVAGIPHTRPEEIRSRIGVLPESAGYPERSSGEEYLRYSPRPPPTTSRPRTRRRS